MNTTTIDTQRLSLNPLSRHHAFMVLELVNTEGWLTFIGDKNIHTLEHAKLFIQTIIEAPTNAYWVLVVKATKVPIGIVTYMDRIDLDLPDLGYALLPDYTGKGYAYEGAQAVVDHLSQAGKDLCAIVKADNTKSINLLHRLGFTYYKNMIRHQEQVCVYKLSKST